MVTAQYEILKAFVLANANTKTDSDQRDSYYSNDTCSTWNTSSPTKSATACVAFCDGVFVCGNNSAVTESLGIYRSSDYGKTWEKGETNARLLHLCGGLYQGQRIFVGGSTTYLRRSVDDGKTWTTSTANTVTLNGVAYGKIDNGSEVFVAAWNCPLDNGITYSYNGGEKFTGTSTNYLNAKGVWFANGEFLTLAKGPDDSCQMLYKSSNAKTWTKVSDVILHGAFHPMTPVVNILYGNGKYLMVTKPYVVGDANKPTFYIPTTSTLSKWSGISNPPVERTVELMAACFGDGVFVVIDENNNVYTSPDGETWSTASTISGKCFGIAYGSPN